MITAIKLNVNATNRISMTKVKPGSIGRIYGTVTKDYDELVVMRLANSFFDVTHPAHEWSKDALRMFLFEPLPVGSVVSFEITEEDR